MARPFLFPVAFATVLFSSPAMADDASATPTATLAVVVATPPADAPPEVVLGPLGPVADPTPCSAGNATRAAGNARLPLYDDECMGSKAAPADAP
jgi:hypothetical protein